MEHNFLKMEKDSCKNVQENMKLAVKKVGFFSFTIFVLKTTSMYFYLTNYYYYTKLTFSSAVLSKKQRCFLDRNAIIPLFSIFMFIDPFPLVIIRTFVRFSKLPLPLVWKRFCWFIPSFFSFLRKYCFYIFFYNS